MFASMRHADAMAACELAGIPFAPITRPEDLFSDPQLNKSTGGLLETTLPNGVQTRLPRLPLEINDADLNLRANPPQIGEHTDEILQSVGYDAGEIRALKSERAIG